MQKSELFLTIATALFALGAFFCVIFVAFSLQGCSAKVEYKETFIPTPQKCDFNISHAPEINTGDLQNMLKSLKDLSFDSKEIRREIRQVPCLNINYKDLK